jgi:hypothetical protein
MVSHTLLPPSSSSFPLLTLSLPRRNNKIKRVKKEEMKEKRKSEYSLRPILNDIFDHFTHIKKNV